MWSDASGTGGFGLITTGSALQGSASLSAAESSSGSYELVPLLCALHRWGPSLRDRIVLWVTDNANDTRVINGGSPPNNTTHLLASEVLSLASHLRLTVLAVWAPRSQLQLLDDLSKFVIRLDHPVYQGETVTDLP
jgi:hypothetical protein